MTLDTQTASPRLAWSRAGVRLLRGLLLGCVLTSLVPASTTLADDASVRKELATAGDFRVRVTAALALGKSKDKANTPALVAALKDDNAAVRSAAASGLAALLDVSALSALERARDAERDTNAKQAMEKAVSTLKAAKQTKWVVSLGKIENKSGDAKAGKVFQSALKSKLAAIPGIEVVSTEEEAVKRAKDRNLPTIAFDGKLVQVSQSKSGKDLAVSAQVEVLIRKIPEQALKATVKGKAQAVIDQKAVKGDAELASLQADAVTAAVDSALKGAPTAIEAAAK
ncbi:MAG: HEAT repeat domain-containing protein [Polyangiaceae bacterium]